MRHRMQILLQLSYYILLFFSVSSGIYGQLISLHSFSKRLSSLTIMAKNFCSLFLVELKSLNMLTTALYKRRSSTLNSVKLFPYYLVNLEDTIKLSILINTATSLNSLASLIIALIASIDFYSFKAFLSISV